MRAQRARLAHRERVRRRLARGPHIPSGRLALAVLAASGLLGALAGERVASRAGLAGVSVAGAHHLAPSEIAAAAGLGPNATAASLGTGELARRLAAHPWIGEARAVRLPTGRLLVEVVEREPVAVLVGPQPRALDVTGAAFAVLDTDDLAGLPRVALAGDTDAEVARTELAAAVALTTRLARRGLVAREVVVSPPADPRGLVVQLAARSQRAVLGRAQLDARLARLAAVLDARIPEVEAAAVLDLRFRDQVVLSDEPLPEGAAQAAVARGGGRSPTKHRSG